MRRTLLLVFALLLALSVPSEGQTLTNREKRHINDRLLALIHEYERTADLFDEDEQYVFCSLFTNEQMPVTCDIIGFPGYLEDMPVSDYVDAIKSEALTFMVEVKDVVKGEMKPMGNGYEIPVQFRKSISYIDRNEYMFSTEQYYQTDLIMNMTVSYDMDTDLCVITGLEAKIESEREFPRGRFYIVNKSDLYDVEQKYHKYIDGLKVGSSTITYNEFDQAYLSPGELTTGDLDVRVFPDTLKRGFNYDVVRFGFDVRKTRLKLHAAVAPFGAYNVQAPTYLTSKTNAFEAGLDIGFTWSAGKASKMGFYFGAGVSMSYIGLSMEPEKPISYDYTTSVLDPGCGLFKDMKIGYEILSAQEQMKFTDIYVPVYFEVEHRAGRHMMISWNFGVKGYYNMNVSPSYTVNGRVQIDNKAFESFEIKDGPFISPLSYSRNPFDVSVCGNLGFDINLFKQRAYFSVKAGYEYGLKDSYSNQGLAYYDVSKKIYPVVYDPAGRQRNVAFHSLITDLKFRRQAVWLQAGFKFKI